jgi:hypothetical protein
MPKKRSGGHGGGQPYDPYEDPTFLAYAKRVRRELIPKLEASSITVSLIPEGETDVKFAVELGLSIMMDKPIIAVVKPGVKMPNKLALVADRIVEGDITTDDGRKRLAATLKEVVDELNNEDEE